MIEHVKPTIRLPAVQGQFGSRLATYTTQLTPSSIETVIGHDPRSKQWKRLPGNVEHIYKHLQRTTTKARLDAVMRYIQYRFAENPVVVGAFPAISIAVQNPTEFEKVQNTESGIGILHFDAGPRNTRVIVDGLGRASATIELLEMSEDPDVPQAKRDLLKALLDKFSLPVVFYMPAPGQAPLSLDEMQQLFHDFNFKVTAVSAQHAIALDHSNLYIGLANRIGESDPIAAAGGMEKKAASLGKKSSAVVVQQNLLRFVAGAIDGEAALEGKVNAERKDANLTEETLDDYQERIISFLTAFAEAMGQDAFKDRERLHLTAPGWAALAAIFYDLNARLKVPDLDAAAARLGALDWRREAPIWADIVKQREDGTLSLVGGSGSANRRFMIKVIRRELGLDDLLKERGLLVDEASDADAPANEEDMDLAEAS